MIVTPITTPAGLLLVAHGLGAKEDELGAPRFAALLHRASRDGWVVADSHAHGDNWGNPESVADQLALARYVTARWHVARTITIGESMGGLDALATAAALHAQWYGISPVTSAQWASRRAAFRRSVTAAWHGGVPTDPPPVTGTACAGTTDRYVPTADNAGTLPGVRIVSRPGGHIPQACYDDALDLIGGL